MSNLHRRGLVLIDNDGIKGAWWGSKFAILTLHGPRSLDKILNSDDPNLKATLADSFGKSAAISCFMTLGIETVTYASLFSYGHEEALLYPVYNLLVDYLFNLQDKDRWKNIS